MQTKKPRDKRLKSDANAVENAVENAEPKHEMKTE